MIVFENIEISKFQLNYENIKNLPHFITQIHIHGFYKEGALKYCKHDWFFIGSVGEAICTKCGNWENEITHVK